MRPERVGKPARRCLQSRLGARKTGDQSARPRVDGIRPWKPQHVRCALNARRPVRLGQRREQAAGRFDVGLGLFSGNQNRDGRPGGIQLLAPGDGGRQHPGRLGSGLEFVDMRRRAVGGVPVRMPDHPGRHRRVHIERADDRQFGSHDGAYALQQFALGIVHVFGAHGTVKREANAVQRPRLRDSRNDGVGNGFKGVP